MKSRPAYARITLTTLRLGGQMPEQGPKPRRGSRADMDYETREVKIAAETGHRTIRKPKNLGPEVERRNV